MSAVSDRLRRWQQGLFGSPTNIAITLAILFFAWTVGIPFLRWALIDATWVGNAEVCRAGTGACWSFIAEKRPIILYGLYPPDHQGWSLAALLLLTLLVGVTAIPRFWHRRLVGVWALILSVSVLFLSGRLTDTPIATDEWGGFTLTLLMTLSGFALAFPLAVFLALGRRSKMAGIRLVSVAYIEIVRGVPFIAVLYAATLLLPLMLPEGTTIDKLVRAIAAVVLFAAAYLAETIRAGLQALPTGQTEAADALGFSYWQKIRLVILPQALRHTIPNLVSLALNMFQDTTLVVVIGMFDFLGATRAAATDGAWYGFYDEAYVFTGLVYFALCLLVSRYSLWLERRLSPFNSR